MTLTLIRDTLVNVHEYAAWDDELGAHAITDYRFERCTIAGPAVLHLAHCRLEDVTFSCTTGSLFWQVANRYITGAIAVRRCEIAHCQFRHIGIIDNLVVKRALDRGDNDGLFRDGLT